MNDTSYKTAAASGATGVLAAGGTMVTVTASLTGPAANLGGYATAQILAGTVGSSTGPLCQCE